MNRIFFLAKDPRATPVFSSPKKVFIPFIPPHPEIQSSILCIPSDRIYMILDMITGFSMINRMFFGKSNSPSPVFSSPPKKKSPSRPSLLILKSSLVSC